MHGEMTRSSAKVSRWTCRRDFGMRITATLGTQAEPPSEPSGMVSFWMLESSNAYLAGSGHVGTTKSHFPRQTPCRVLLAALAAEPRPRRPHSYLFFLRIDRNLTPTQTPFDSPHPTSA
jgi:hypothetical protein